jgi:hypothetical protein
MNFTMDMKRLGIMADIQGVQETKKKLIIKCRHISPPPGETQPCDKDEDIVSTHSRVQPKAVNNSKSLFKFPF